MIFINVKTQDLKPIIENQETVNIKGESHNIVEYKEPGSEITEVKFIEDEDQDGDSHLILKSPSVSDSDSESTVVRRLSSHFSAKIMETNKKMTVTEFYNFY